MSRLRRFCSWLCDLFPDDPVAAKSMALLGPNAFGPPCPTCGKPDWRYMPARHYAYANRMALKQHDKPLCRLAGLCQCGPAR